MICEFDQDMMNPLKIDQSLYKNVLKLRLLKGDVEVQTEGSFVNKTIELKVPKPQREL
jgi:hypothetical protein